MLKFCIISYHTIPEISKNLILIPKIINEISRWFPPVILSCTTKEKLDDETRTRLQLNLVLYEWISPRHTAHIRRGQIILSNTTRPRLRNPQVKILFT